MTPDQVVAFLLDKKLLEVRHVVQGALQIGEVVYRNRSFRVVTTGGPSYFVKQLVPGEYSAPPLEAALYSRFDAQPPWNRMRAFVPALRLYDAARSVLVLELAAPAAQAPGVDAPGADDDFPRIGEAWARALAACHDIIAALDGPADWAFLPSEPAWSLDVTRPVPDALQDMSAGQLHLLRALQAEPDVDGLLDRLRGLWRATSLIHGDVKWSNVLIHIAAAGDGPPRTLLVDWEMASLGDPAWDVGAVLHSYLAHAIVSVPTEEDITPAAAAAAFEAALPAIHPEVRTFWRTYTREAGVVGRPAALFLDKCTGYCAARLLHTAYEWSQQEAEAPRRALAALQIGLNLLRQPEAGRVALLGLGERSQVA